jgi:hypothetical protein
MGYLPRWQERVLDRLFERGHVSQVMVVSGA